MLSAELNITRDVTLIGEAAADSTSQLVTLDAGKSSYGADYSTVLMQHQHGGVTTHPAHWFECARVGAQPDADGGVDAAIQRPWVAVRCPTRAI